MRNDVAPTTRAITPSALLQLSAQAQRQVKLCRSAMKSTRLEIKKETPRQSSEGKVFYITECYTGKYVMKLATFVLLSVV